MACYFISDLHLPADPDDALCRRFFHFLKHRAADMQALYILGDLVEAWMGDDLGEQAYGPLLQELSTLAARGCALYLMWGNHDFLLSRQWIHKLGAQWLDDVVAVDLYGRTAVLCHGDTLCTRDKGYQEMRVRFRTPVWQAHFLSRTPGERQAFVQQLVQTSAKAVGEKSGREMEVVQDAVEQLLTLHRADLLIHGHTHLPGVHEFLLRGVRCQRVVLGAWQQQGEILRYDTDGFVLRSIGAG